MTSFDPNSTISLIENLLSVITLLVVAVFGVSIAYFIVYIIKRFFLKQPKEDALVAKLNRLNHIFNEAQELIPEIAGEMTIKQQAVNKLRTEYETYQNIPAMSKENLAALQTVFRNQLKSDLVKSTFWNILIGAFFFVLGFVVQKYLSTSTIF